MHFVSSLNDILSVSSYFVFVLHRWSNRLIVQYFLIQKLIV